MKKLFALMISLALFCSVAITPAWAGSGPSGPAPNAGDGVSDGSGMDSGPNSGNGSAPGPAPNSGDGVPDGSGF